jgi:3-hydroxyacyl-[acyl-carrier-protein] dehydratase
MSESPLAYLPHRPPMVLVDEIERVEEASRTIRCSFRVKEDFFLCGEEGIPGVVLVEIMAQASACLKGWIDVHRGLPVRIGYLVGIEEVNFHDELRPGDRLEIDAEMTQELSNYFGFSCRVSRDGAPVADALLSFMVQ